MSVGSYEADDIRLVKQEMFQDDASDQHGLLGLIALIGLAIPALLIRSLLPDLNPVFLAGLGSAVYLAYLGVMVVTLMRQAEQGQLAPETIGVTADHE